MLANRLGRLKRDETKCPLPRLAGRSAGTSYLYSTLAFQPLRRFFAPLSLLAGLSLLGISPVSAQAIRGRVLEAGSDRPVVAANVSLIDEKGAAAATAVTDSAGSFVIRPPRPAKYWVRAQRLGYVTLLSLAIEFTGSTTPDVTIRLQPRGIPLDTLRVRAERGELEIGRSQFARRCGSTEAICLTQARIKATGAVWPTDVFNAIPGMAVIDNGRTRTVRSFEGWGCFVIFLNHQTRPLQSARGGTPAVMHMDELVLADIVAIEIYKSFREVPLELRESMLMPEIWPVDLSLRRPQIGACGVARVWTKAAW